VGKDPGVSFGFLSWETDREGGGGEGGALTHEKDGCHSDKAESLRQKLLFSEREEAAAHMLVMDK